MCDLDSFLVANPLLDTVMAKYIISHVGDQFCQLVEQEKEAMSWVSPDSKLFLDVSSIVIKKKACS